MLRLERITAGYGLISVLRDVSMTVAAGTITALIGSNGAGKSTTLKAIMQAIPISGGEIFLGDRSLRGLSRNQVVVSGISLVPEGRKIFPGLTVVENLRAGAFVCRDRREIARRLDGVFELFPQLAERQRTIGTQLSGGQQQMLAIARAIMAEPRMLLLDEPSMGLAPIVTRQVFKAIATLRERGCTILLVEQNTRLALSVADYAYVLENGRIVLEDKAAVLGLNQAIIDAYLGG
jgi:branched-chain amino acid transport system ATP-binding protein